MSVMNEILGKIIDFVITYQGELMAIFIAIGTILVMALGIAYLVKTR